MVQLRVDLKGIDGIVEKLEKKKDLTPVRNVVMKHGALLKNKVISNMNAAYSAGYSTGATKRSVTNEISNGGLTATVSGHTEYLPYLEYGTRFMSPRPTLHPAFAYQSIQFVNDLKKVLNE